MPFVITYTAWKYLLQEKEKNKKKDEKLAKVEKHKERKIRKKWETDTAGKSSTDKKTTIKERVLTAPRMLDLASDFTI
jgi:hypothetical protein